MNDWEKHIKRIDEIVNSGVAQWGQVGGCAGLIYFDRSLIDEILRLPDQWILTYLTVYRIRLRNLIEHYVRYNSDITWQMQSNAVLYTQILAVATAYMEGCKNKQFIQFYDFCCRGVTGEWVFKKYWPKLCGCNGVNDDYAKNSTKREDLENGFSEGLKWRHWHWFDLAEAFGLVWSRPNYGFFSFNFCDHKKFESIRGDVARALISPSHRFDNKSSEKHLIEDYMNCIKRICAAFRWMPTRKPDYDKYDEIGDFGDMALDNIECARELASSAEMNEAYRGLSFLVDAAAIVVLKWKDDKPYEKLSLAEETPCEEDYREWCKDVVVQEKEDR